MPIQGLLTGGGQPQAGGLFAGLGDKIRAREDYDKKKTQIIKTAMKQGKSWQDIAQQTGLDLEEIRSLSQAIDPSYGIDTRSSATKVKDGSLGFINTFGGAIESVIQDVTGGTARREKLLEDKQKLISLRKKEIERSGVLSPETKKKLIGELTAQQRSSYAKATARRTAELGELNRTLENPVIRGGAAFGAGVKRSGEGVAQGVGGIYDLATPGKGQSRLTQAATRSAEGSDRFVQDNQLSDVAYKGGQLTGEVLQLLTGTKAIKAMASLPGASKLVAVAGKADELENLLRIVNKGGKAGDAAITAARYLLDPARVANIVGNTAVDQGQLSARGQDINAKTVGTSVGLNYALGGVLDAASAGLTRRATNKANVAQDAATLADNARINEQMAGAGDLASELPTPGQRQLGAGSPQPVQTAGASGGVMQTNVPATSDLKRLEVVQKKIANAQKRGGLGAEEARALMRERAALIDRIQNPTGAQGTPTPTTGSISSATAVDQPTLTQDLPTGSRTGATATSQPGEMRTSGTALSTEQRAIEEHLTNEFEGLAQYKSTSFKQDAIDATDLVSSDPARARAIAFGEIAGNNPSHEVAVKKAVELEAIKNRDVATLQRIAQSSSNTRASEAAQRLGAEGYNRDPTSPVENMKAVLDARKNSKIKGVPKDLSPEEAEKITSLAADAEAKRGLAENSPPNSKERYDYGLALVEQRRYRNELLDAAKTGKEKYAPTGYFKAIAGTLKSAKTTFDNSFFGRQGRNMLTNHPIIWSKAFLKSFGDMAKGIRKIDVLDALDAELLSRPNAMNGMYKRMGVDLHNVEEAFPSSLPEKIPALGRLFRASEYAYTAGAHRMRADLADLFIEKAQKNGVDFADKDSAESIGMLVNAMTGRGNLKSLSGKAAEAANVLFFSPRNFRANFDTLTAHQFQTFGKKDAGAKFVRKEAAKNLANIVITTAATLAIANELSPGSVEWDPRSSNFGKIKIGNTRFDITGGISPIITLASRLVPTPGRDGWGRRSKSSTTGMVTRLNSGVYGSRDGWQVFQDFVDGKLSPTASAVRQVLKGTTYTGDKVTPTSLAKDLIVPLPITNYEELKNDPNSANVLMAMILDGLGVGTNTYSAQKDWNQVNTKRIQGFKQTVDAKTFATANNDFNEEYNRWFDDVRRNPKYKNISDDTKKTLINQKKQDLTDEILGRYGYKYKRETKQDGEKKTIKDLMSL